MYKKKKRTKRLDIINFEETSCFTYNNCISKVWNYCKRCWHSIFVLHSISVNTGHVWFYKKKVKMDNLSGSVKINLRIKIDEQLRQDGIERDNKI